MCLESMWKLSSNNADFGLKKDHSNSESPESEEETEGDELK